MGKENSQNSSSKEQGSADQGTPDQMARGHEKHGAKIQPVRGTRDLLFEECAKFRSIENLARHTASLYGFQEIQTPIIESSAVFKRSLGTSSDIVTKEMYCFQDLGGDELVLRPEGTAGIARAFISEGLTQHIPLKLFYTGPMFRYERPQKGRYRQFFQIGAEILGVEKPQADLELIALAWQFLRDLKLEDQIVLHLNTIGDAESRAAFRDKLVAYLRTRAGELSVESQERLIKNPLRILDSKDENDRKVIADAPTLESSLNESSREFFSAIVGGLRHLEIPFVIDPHLVRGLDYYCHTVFEFKTGSLGAQNAILAGGRYDGLISDLGGPHTPGVGFAAGTDRLALMVNEAVEATRTVAVIPVGDGADLAALKISQTLRQAGLPVDIGFSGNLAKRMKRANKLLARFAIILGSDELARGVVQLKNLDTGEQNEIGIEDLLKKVKA